MIRLPLISDPFGSCILTLTVYIVHSISLSPLITRFLYHMKLLVVGVLLAALPSAFAWGAAGELNAHNDNLTVGHEIVATIAQIHLHPNVQKKLCDILPAQAKCHLAPVAAWADQVKWHYPGSAVMHYVNRESLLYATNP